jgi:phenylalanyl-tRNA synthetase alpha chain
MQTLTSDELEKTLNELEENALKSIAAAQSEAELESARLEFLGKEGSVSKILKQLGQLSPDEKPRVGQRANHVRDSIQDALAKRKHLLYQKELETKLLTETIDVTMPGTKPPLGHIHPLRQITTEIVTIFYGMGFTAVEGPEVETDYYNFDALNTPANHPARDEQDTFYTNLGPSILLRSQTSTVQIRVMEKQKPPLRVISHGRVYRNEEVNARKYPIFHQLEGLLIDKNVTLGDLKGTLNEFIRLLFGKPMKTRFRPDFFPFTEPSAELDSQCPFCDGKGCRTCGHRGWLELLGCGMVDPNVLKGVGIDPEEFSGFAFGMGIERLAMLKYDINDIRHFWTNDLRFLEQF